MHEQLRAGHLTRFFLQRLLDYACMLHCFSLVELHFVHYLQCNTCRTAPAPAQRPPLLQASLQQAQLPISPRPPTDGARPASMRPMSALPAAARRSSGVPQLGLVPAIDSSPSTAVGRGAFVDAAAGGPLPAAAAGPPGADVPPAAGLVAGARIGAVCTGVEEAHAGSAFATENPSLPVSISSPSAAAEAVAPAGSVIPEDEVPELVPACL